MNSLSQDWQSVVLTGGWDLLIAANPDRVFLRIFFAGIGFGYISSLRGASNLVGEWTLETFTPLDLLYSKFGPYITSEFYCKGTAGSIVTSTEVYQ